MVLALLLVGCGDDAQPTTTTVDCRATAARLEEIARSTYPEAHPMDAEVRQLLARLEAADCQP